MMSRGGIVAILWAPYEERTTLFAQRLDARLYKIHYLRYKRPIYAPFKYPLQCLKTWVVLTQQRPSIVYVMNPPVFGVLSVFAYCRLFGADFIMDTHSPALYCRKWAWTVPLQRALARRALVNIVDQQRYKELFESWGARALILARPLRTIHGKTPENLACVPQAARPAPGTRARGQVAPYVLGGEVNPNEFSVTVVGTFASDEPLELVLGAARQLPGVRFYVLGDTGLAKKDLLRAAPDNVVFTGYLLEDDYWRRLSSSNVVMVLTTWPYSLLAGAQEAMALGKPLILSKQPALTEFFTEGAIFVDHSVESLVTGVREAEEHGRRLEAEIAHLRVEKQERWEVAFQELLALTRGVPWQNLPSES